MGRFQVDRSAVALPELNRACVLCVRLVKIAVCKAGKDLQKSLRASYFLKI